MKKIYTLILAALTSVAAMAQANHPAVIKGMPRINEATAELPALRHAAPQKAGGQVLPINKTDPVKLYTNEAYSWEGHYDYYFSFANSDDEFFFPMIFFDLYLPTADGLQEGTYKMSEGTVDENLMVMANFNDYVYYMYGYLAYEWADATITLTKGEGDNVWTVDFSVTTIEDFTFSFNYTGEFPVEEDDFDPNDQEEPEVQYTYDYEPDTAEKYDLVFQAPDCSDSFVDEYKLYDIYLDHTDVLDNGRFFEGHLYLVTNEHQPHADLYPSIPAVRSTPSSPLRVVPKALRRTLPASSARPTISTSMTPGTSWRARSLSATTPTARSCSRATSPPTKAASSTSPPPTTSTASTPYSLTARRPAAPSGSATARSTSTVVTSSTTLLVSA